MLALVQPTPQPISGGLSWPMDWLAYLDSATPSQRDDLHMALLTLRPLNAQRQHPAEPHTHGLTELRVLLCYGRGAEGAERQQRLLGELKHGAAYLVRCTRTWHDAADDALCLLGDTTLIRAGLRDVLARVRA